MAVVGMLPVFFLLLWWSHKEGMLTDRQTMGYVFTWLLLLGAFLVFGWPLGYIFYPSGFLLCVLIIHAFY
ncbi:MAG: hypothetical protein ABL962_09275 [Fimbriimonadaceae bacterium]